MTLIFLAVLMIIRYKSLVIALVISSLQESAEKLFQWFSHNQMKGNTDKCHLINSTVEPIEIRVGESLIKNSTCEKLLGVKLITNLILILVPKVFVKRQIVN